VYVGVDGHRLGWVAVALDRRRAYADAWTAPTLERLLTDVPVGTTVGVDIPLGLLERGWRSADRLAAARLGPRRSSVFAVPPRLVWAATTLAEATVLCRRLCDGASFSVQAWGLRGKVLEADAYREVGRHDLVEVHPELAFAALAGSPMANPKKSWNGQHTRRRALRDAGIDLPDELPLAGSVPVDDVLDAAAVAWSAARLALGTGVALPDPPDQFDRGGRPIRIHF
jgi:predicted RNase H-like nuclease